MSDASRRAYKNDWQRKQRREFRVMNGYSTAANYATGNLRQVVLERDQYRCIRCGMTAEQHMNKWKRPITIDHKDKSRRNNSLENLQTLCLSCHGKKDQIWKTKVARIPVHKPEILRMRANGATYQEIADLLEFSIGTVHKWCKRWEKEQA